MNLPFHVFTAFAIFTYTPGFSKLLDLPRVMPESLETVCTRNDHQCIYILSIVIAIAQVG